MKGQVTFYPADARKNGFVSSVNIGDNYRRSVVQLKPFSRSTVLFIANDDHMIHFQIGNTIDYNNFKISTGL